MSAEAADARVERLGLLSRGALVAGALFEGRLTTLTVPLAAITPSTHEGHSPLRRVVVAASAAGYTAVARSWWVEQAREVAGLSETEARLLFDQVGSLSRSLCARTRARVCVSLSLSKMLLHQAVVWGGDVSMLQGKDRGAFLRMREEDPRVVRACLFLCRIVLSPCLSVPLSLPRCVSPLRPIRQGGSR